MEGVKRPVEAFKEFCSRGDSIWVRVITVGIAKIGLIELTFTTC